MQVGLAQYQDYGYFSLDPALSPYLRLQLPKTELAKLQQRWLVAMQALVGFLYEQAFEDAQLAAQLTLSELPNLLSLLTALPQQHDVERTADIAGSIEALLANLQQPQALALAVRVRRVAMAQCSVWSHRQFANQRLDIERLLEQGDLQAALTQAQNLLNQAQQAGAAAYAEAAYDSAMAYKLFGQVLNTSGLAEAALAPLQQARQQFQALADAGNQDAAVMVAATLTEQGDCLTALGQLKAAADCYLQGIDLSEKLSDKRQVAVSKGQLATVRLYQKDYATALSAYQEAKDTFSQLNEPLSVAIVWHQIGMVYRQMQDYEEAERAYKESLKIATQQGHASGVASSLGELGNLYDAWGRLEQAMVFYKQAADGYSQLGDKRSEGFARTNLANSLIKLQRTDEARDELQRAIDCKKAFGHSATPWTTWNILHNLELACANPIAAHAAKQQAIDCYYRYRRDGGENMSGSQVPQFCARVLQAIHDNQQAALLQEWADVQIDDLPDYLKPVLPKLIAILHGERATTLADDDALYYDDAVELLLLLERL